MPGEPVFGETVGPVCRRAALPCDVDPDVANRDVANRDVANREVAGR